MINCRICFCCFLWCNFAGIRLTLLATVATLILGCNQNGAIALFLEIVEPKAARVESDGNGKAAGTIVVRNTSARKRRIFVSGSCGCTSLTPNDFEIDSNETREVRFEIQLGFPGDAKAVSVVFSDPTQAIVAPPVRLTTEWKLPWTSSTLAVDFGVLTG